MMKSLIAALLLLGGALVASDALADGGYYAGTLGATATGRGGAVTAKADDLTAVSYNPAGLAKLDGGIIQLGNTASYNYYSYSRAATLDYGHPDGTTGQPPLVTFDKVYNRTPWQALDPLIGVASKFGLKDWGFALAAYAPPGISKEEFPQGSSNSPSAGGQRYQMISREAMILEYVASLAWKYQDVFGIGASAQWIYVPRLNYSLMIDGTVFNQAANPVSSDYDILATMKGSSAFTFNAILGAFYRPAPFLEFGVSGQVVPANIVAKSTLDVTPIGSAVGRVSLVRGNQEANDVTVTMPLPMVFRAGSRYRHLDGAREVFDIELDVDYVTWSRVNRFTVETNGLTAVRGADKIKLGTINIDKHWKDQVAFRLGGDYAVLPHLLTLRAGAYYESAVSDGAYDSVDFPTGAQIGGGVGTSVFLGKLEVVLAYQLRVQPSVFTSEKNARGYQQVPGSKCQPPYTDQNNCNANLLNQPSPVVNAGAYSAASQFLALDLLYHYGL
jgi:long-chain fatty acid transport protein